MDNYWMVEEIGKARVDDLLRDAASVRRFLTSKKSRLATLLQSLIIILG